LLPEPQKIKVLIIYLTIIAIKDLLPGIMKQLGAKQFSFIKEYADQLKRNNDIKGDKKVDEAPELVENFEDVSKQD